MAWRGLARPGRARQGRRGGAWLGQARRGETRQLIKRLPSGGLFYGYNMQILFTGKGTSGSWKIRGEQLGHVIGNVQVKADLQACKRADVIVVVKRINAPFINNVLKSKTPWIWDLVDFYPQPICSTWNLEMATHWLRGQIEVAKPHGIIWPNARMKKDADLPGEVIYHHARQAPINPIRRQVKTVGYDGCAAYLGRWRSVIETLCAERRWQFKIGIPLDQMDIVVALRDGQYNGYVQSNWKSNVKLANAHGTGTPFIGGPEPGYLETATGEERFITSAKGLEIAFDDLSSYETRKRISGTFLGGAIKLDSVANQMRCYAASLHRH